MRIAREPIHHAAESLRCLHLALPAFAGELHRHGHLELTWIERGQGLRWVGDSVAPFFDGDMVLVGSETPHLWASRAASLAQGCAATVLQFPPGLLQGSGLPELQALAPLLVLAAGAVEVLGATRSEVQALLARLPGAPAPRRLAVFIEVMGCLQAGAGAGELRPLSAHRRPAPPAAASPAARAGPRPQRIDRVLSWIEAHLAETLTVEQAAAVAHVSPAAFGRFFRREVGKSFTAYVNDARCGWAALRLVQGREPVAHIAQACGFATLSHFGEQFRRRYGMAARDFRAGQLTRGRKLALPTAQAKPAGAPNSPAVAGAVPAAVAVIVLHRQLVLLGRMRGPGETAAGGGLPWAGPGALLRPGEQIEDCARRALAEQAGLLASVVELGPYSNDFLAGPAAQRLTVFVVARGVQGVPRNLVPEACEGWAWFPWDNPPQPLCVPWASMRAIGWRPGGA